MYSAARQPGKGKKAVSKKHPDGTEAGKTLYVCVRDRAGKSASCAGSGARALLSAMQGILKVEDIGQEELRVRPVGCLGLCKRGPVLLAIPGTVAAQKKPKKPGKKSRGVYTRVELKEARDVLREVLLAGEPN